MKHMWKKAITKALRSSFGNRSSWQSAAWQSAAWQSAAWQSAAWQSAK